MSLKDKKLGLDAITRRDFLVSSAAVGMGMMVGKSVFAQQEEAPAFHQDPVNVAVIGVGDQGEALINACKLIPGLRFKAICDIWEAPRGRWTKLLEYAGHKVNPYEDYRVMLEKEKDLHAVIVATPDWMHAEHANACMEAGMHVYCEKEMSNSLDKARSMVLTQRKTGKLLQIGHQRRSNPRYRHAIDVLMHKEDLLGRISHAYAQWNRSKASSEDLGWAERDAIPAETLKKYGYESMHEFRNWRWYKKYGGGPIVDLGSHQIDIFSWVFGGPPTAVTADGGIDFYPQHEWYDNVMAIYEFDTARGPARAFYQVLTTTGYGGFSEAFMGDDGTVQISEVPTRGNWAQREAGVEPVRWNELARRGLIQNVVEPLKVSANKNVIVDVRVTPQIGKWPLPIELAKPPHQPHLENFFDAIRHGAPLNCPAELGYETAVMVLAANDAVANKSKLHFKPEDFVV
jgi:predicted dehydrogenase